MIDVSSPFKAAPRISETTFLSVLRDVGSFTSPLWNGVPVDDREDVASAMYASIVAAGHDPAVWLAIAFCEHRAGTDTNSVLHRNDTRSWTNARTVRNPHLTGWEVIRDAVRGSNYVKYQSVVDSLLDGLYRVDEPGYAYRKANAKSIIDHTMIWTEGDGPQYAAKMAALINDWMEDAPMPEPVPPIYAPHIALAAGHWNTAGGNHDERETVRPLAFEIERQLRAHGGFRVTMMTPGSGNFPGDHNAVARAVLDLHGRDPVDLYFECHTEGTGNPANRGAFGVVPWWPKANPTDRDADADTISVGIATRLRDTTGIPLKTTNIVQPGVMAEYQTGVGGQGFRLGVFAMTEPAKATMTRMIFEYGAHTNPVDFAIQREPWFTERAARATVEAIAAFYGVAVEPREPQGPAPAVPDPNAQHFPQTDKWIVNQPGAPMLTAWRNKGGVAVCGYPLTGMTHDADGVYRQTFENVLIEIYPDGLIRFGGLGQRYMAALARIAELEGP